MNDEPQITAEQAKGARVLLGYGPMHVCRLLAMTPRTLDRAEISTRSAGPASKTVYVRLRRFYEANGIEFTNGDQPSVRMKAAGADAITSGDDLNSASDT
jgi:hypothetical protein